MRVKERTAGRGGRVLVAALVVDSTGTGLLLPLYLVYFLHLTEVPLGTLGVLATLANTVTLPIPVWVGSLADRYGSVPLVVAAQLFQAVGYASFGVVDEPVGIFVALTLVTLGVRVFWGSVFSLLADYADSTGSRASKDSWFSWATIARTAGLTVGGLIAGAAVADGRESTYQLVSYGAAACFLAAAASIAMRVRAPGVRHVATGAASEPGGGAGYRGLLRDRIFLAYTGINVVSALSGLMLALALPTAILVGLQGPRWLATVALVGNAVLVTVGTRVLVQRLSGHRRTRTLLAAAILWAVWSILLAVAPPAVPTWIVGIVIVSTVLFTLAEAVHGPVSTALAAALAPTGSRGRYLAMFQYSFAIAGVIGPVFFTHLFELHRAAPWVALAALNLAAGAGLVALENSLPAQALATTPAPEPEDAGRPVVA